MIPIVLVTGFLGSGKTTLLCRLARTHRDRRWVYLVNDFAAADVDGVLASEAGEPVVSIAGGSIFCKCLVTDFIRYLGAIARGETAPWGVPEAVLIEASGIADPRVIGTMLEETGLNRAYRLAAILSIVDPGRFLKLLHTLPNIRAQIEAATVVLVNQVDRYGDEVVREAEEQILRIQPGVTLKRTVRCETDLDLFGRAAPSKCEGAYAPCADPAFAKWSVPLEGDHSPEALAHLIESLGDDLYRAKGFVRDNGKAYLLDYAGGACSVGEAPRKDVPAVLAVIARGEAAARVKERFDQYLASPGAA